MLHSNLVDLHTGIEGSHGMTIAYILSLVSVKIVTVIRKIAVIHAYRVSSRHKENDIPDAGINRTILTCIHFHLIGY